MNDYRIWRFKESRLNVYAPIHRGSKEKFNEKLEDEIVPKENKVLVMWDFKAQRDKKGHIKQLVNKQ